MQAHVAWEATIRKRIGILWRDYALQDSEDTIVSVAEEEAKKRYT